MLKKILLISFALAIPLCQTLEGAITFRNGKIVDADLIPTLPGEAHFGIGMEAFENHNWTETVRQLTIVTRHFSNAPYAQEAFFYLGIAYFKCEELEFSNDAFSSYIDCQTNPQCFLEAVQFKLAIADQFRCGAKRRFFGLKQLPKWLSAKDKALGIYDEVVAAMPCHDIAARALFAKASLQWECQDYRETVTTYQMLIRRFPKHELAAESYLMISQVYLDQAHVEFQNPDLIAFAELNLRRFKADFPSEERIVLAETNYQYINEVYAHGLYDTGRFYERVGKPCSSVIYYNQVLSLFANTNTAKCCQDRLNELAKDGIQIAMQTNDKENSTKDLKIESFDDLPDESKS